MKPEKVDRTTRKRKPDMHAGAASAPSGGILQQCNDDNLRLSTSSSSSTPPREESKFLELMQQSPENRTIVSSPRPDVMYVSVIRKMPGISSPSRDWTHSCLASGCRSEGESVVVSASDRRLGVVASSYSTQESESPEWVYLGASPSYRPPSPLSTNSQSEVSIKTQKICK